MGFERLHLGALGKRLAALMRIGQLASLLPDDTEQPLQSQALLGST